MEFIIKTLRTLFFSLDKVIYGLIDDVYGLLLQLTRTSVFSQETIHQFAERIYALVGIFMLFKVTISLVNYVLNPDDFTDKEKGLGSIVKHVILSLVMIVLVPYIFNEAFELQSIILEENTIMNLVFGSPSSRELNISNSSYAESAGQKIQFTIMYAFTQPNYDDFFNDAEYDLADCKHTYVEDTDGNYTFRKTPVFDNVASEDSNFIYALNESCWGVYDPNTDTYVEDGENGQLLGAFKSIDSGDVVYQNYAQGVAQQSFNMFFRQDVILAKEADGSRYFVDYKMGISTAVGVGTLYLLLMFCIDIAVRSVKLGFLQMIAPIPILSYCDPKSGKDGMFKKWTSMCVKTYLDLFIRLFALYFGIYVITLIGKFRDVSTGEVVSGWLVSIFMIVGILIFVKKLPDILKESLGLDGGTFKDFKLNPLKRLENDMLGAKQIAGVGAAGLAGAAAFGTNLIARKGNVFSALAGGLSATGRGLKGTIKGEKFGKNFSNSYSGAMTARQNRADRKELGVNAFDTMSQRLRQNMGMATKDQIQDSQIKRYDEATKALDAAKSRAEGEVDKKADSIITATGQRLGALRDAHELWKNMNAKDYMATHGAAWASAHGGTAMTEADAIAKISEEAAKANTEYFKARKAATNEYVERSINGTLDAAAAFGGGSAFTIKTDVTVNSNVSKAESAVDSYDLKDINGARVTINHSDIGAADQDLKDASIQIQSSDEYRRAHLVSEQTKRQK